MNASVNVDPTVKSNVKYGIRIWQDGGVWVLPRRHLIKTHNKYKYDPTEYGHIARHFHEVIIELIVELLHTYIIVNYEFITVRLEICYNYN